MGKSIDGKSEGKLMTGTPFPEILKTSGLATVFATF
jgi:hypothetical protein